MQNYKKNPKKGYRLPIISYFCIVMKIFTRTQIQELDNYTIEHEPIKSIDLMERASRAITNAITDRWTPNVPVVVFAGPGNNGGDALAVARMLIDQNYQVQIYLFNITGHLSEGCKGMLVVDGLFGSGLNKPLAGGFASLVKYINSSNAQVVSIDVPSGLMTEDNTYNVRANIIKATLTLTLQQRKLSFLFAENQQFIGELKILDIRLSKEGIEKIEAQYTTIEDKDIYPILKPRDPFAHKGTMGHALLVAGSYGMAGAAVLATQACMRSGAGKVTVHTPKRNVQILQTTTPEAILHTDREETFFSEAMATDDYQALGIGPGLGTTEQTSIAMIAQIRRAQCPVVADADALNILGTRHAWMQQLPKGIILTPHPKELDRMEGQSLDSYERLTKARQLAEKLQGYIILKGHYTAICMPDGHVAFNTTGNAGMATAGSGDVLTGILTGLLARGYQQREACLLGVYLHGLAGDLAARELGEESLIASDIIRFLPKAFLKVKK